MTQTWMNQRFLRLGPNDFDEGAGDWDFFLNDSRSHILWVTKLWIELVFSLQMASLLNAPSFLLNAVCSLYNYIPLCIFAYHCWLQMVLFEHWNAASVTSATSLVHPAEIVKVHFVSIGNVSPLADVQNIWTAVAKVKSGSWDFHSPKRDATFPSVETLTRRNPTKFSSSSQLRLAQLACFFLSDQFLGKICDPETKSEGCPPAAVLRRNTLSKLSRLQGQDVSMLVPILKVWAFGTEALRQNCNQQTVKLVGNPYWSWKWWKVKRALFIFASPIDQGQVPQKSAVVCGIYHMRTGLFQKVGW